VSQTRSDAEGLGGSSAQIDPQQDADERTAAEEEYEDYGDVDSEEETDSGVSDDSEQYEDYGDVDEDDDGDSGEGSDGAAKGAKARTKAKPKRGERRKAPAGKRAAGKSSGAKTAPKKPVQPRRKRTSPGLYYRQIVAEMRKVVWPTRSELMTYTSVVIVFVLAIIGFVALIDLGVERAVQAIFG
jgi:preprotein translocase subunit SecE